MSDEQIAQQEATALEAVKKQGTDRIACTMQGAALAAAIQSEQDGKLSTETWKACKMPNRACPDVKRLANGCRSGACQEGKLTIQCGTLETGLHTCELSAEPNDALVVGCKDGALVFSTGS